MKLFAWCDAPTAPTGFGRSAKHVLHALHDAGYEITQLAVNYDPASRSQIPWEVFGPSDRASDPYGLRDLGPLVSSRRFDLMWTTFDPEVPWRYGLPGASPAMDALSALLSLRFKNPGFKIAGWFPVDGGPLSDYELAVLGCGDAIDRPVTMSPHVYDLIEWTMRLRGRIPEGAKFDSSGIRKRLGCIPHGVDLSAYRIPTPEERAEAKTRLGFAPDDFVILQVERNQMRKQNYLGLSVLERLRKMKPKGIDPSKIRLFQHMLRDEDNEGCRLGFNLPELAWRYGLKPDVDVRWPGGFVNDEDMVRVVYAAGDAFLSCSTGEGFQYPAWEALSCGVPLVVPNADARRAWFGNLHAPNVHLYDARPDSLVMRGGYNRRMALPDPTAAANVLRKMIHRKKSYLPEAEAGRAWVKKHADVAVVQSAWVDVVNGMRDELVQQRRTMQIVVPGTVASYHVRMLHDPGFGDLMMAAPALRALRKRGTVALEVQRSHLDIAALLSLADYYTTPDGDQPLLADSHSVKDLSRLYYPQRDASWTSTTVPRFEVIAKVLGVSPEELEPFGADLPAKMLQDAEQAFVDRFGVPPRSCVGLAFQSGSPHRALPNGLYRALHPKLKELGLIPVVLGSRAMGIETMGVIDLTGKTDTTALLGIIAHLGAVVSADTSILHFAGALGTPTVGCYTLFSPETRWCYAADHEAVVPERPVGSETFPAGVYTKAPEGEWASQITASRVAAALRELLGVEQPAAPVLTLPEDRS